MAAWIQIALFVVAVLSVVGLIALQLVTRTVLPGSDRSVGRDTQPALFWVIIGIQAFFLIASIVLAVVQLVLGM